MAASETDSVRGKLEALAVSESAESGATGGAEGAYHEDRFKDPSKLTLLERGEQLHKAEQIFLQNTKYAKDGNTEKNGHVLLGTQAGQGVGKSRFAAELGKYCESQWGSTVRVVLLDFGNGSRLNDADLHTLLKCREIGEDGLSKLLGARIHAALNWGTSLARVRDEHPSEMPYVTVKHALEAGRTKIAGDGEDLHVVVVLDEYDRIFGFFESIKEQYKEPSEATLQFVEQLGELMVTPSEGGSSFSNAYKIFVHTFMCATQGKTVFRTSSFAFNIDDEIHLEPFRKQETLRSLLHESGVWGMALSPDTQRQLLHAAWLVRHPREFVQFVRQLQDVIRTSGDAVITISSLVDAAFTLSVGRRSHAALAGRLSRGRLTSILCVAVLEEDIKTPVELRSEGKDDVETLAECAPQLGVLHATDGRATFAVADLFRIATATKDMVLPYKIRITNPFIDATHFEMFDAWMTAARVWFARLEQSDVPRNATAKATIGDLFPGASFHPEADAKIQVQLPNQFKPVVDVKRKLWTSKKRDEWPSVSDVNGLCAKMHHLFCDGETFFDGLHKFESDAGPVWVIKQHKFYADESGMGQAMVDAWFKEAHAAVSGLRESVTVIVMWVTSQKMTDDARAPMTNYKHSALICGNDATTAWPQQLVRLYQIRPPREFVSIGAAT